MLSVVVIPATSMDSDMLTQYVKKSSTIKVILLLVLSSPSYRVCGRGVHDANEAKEQIILRARSRAHNRHLPVEIK